MKLHKLWIMYGCTALLAVVAPLNVAHGQVAGITVAFDCVGARPFSGSMNLTPNGVVPGIGQTYWGSAYVGSSIDPNGFAVVAVLAAASPQFPNRIGLCLAWGFSQNTSMPNPATASLSSDNCGILVERGTKFLFNGGRLFNGGGNQEQVECTIAVQ